MMENAIYSVISPEGCASILWKDPAQAPKAAAALKLTAPNLLELGIIDGIVKEPLGGAHSDFDAAAAALKEAIIEAFSELSELSAEELVEERYQKFARMGSVG
jgi:acetyl-CoA carboxylase carboxyl transferase subunit alpha